MKVFRIYTHKRTTLLAWAKVYIAEGFRVRPVERWGRKNGQSKYMLEIYNPGLVPQAFENKVNEIWNTKIR